MVPVAGSPRAPCPDAAAILTRMAADISEITESNQPGTEEMLAHILTDLHDALKMLTEQGRLLAKHDAMLERFRPLIDQYSSPVAAYTAARRARRNHEPA
jgi:hypothetical protein